ncbi:peptidoglycan D,D-transpeptidase FtsI family protein [Spongisporangium articulatum]|uniref:Peptidoglycan D,D-transpeptidase FtsI family protein n=1 Tax=Spongisporangium articulatum TaxID=3362603 RepID=A0ABW8ASU6_9ACTN
MTGAGRPPSGTRARTTGVPAQTRAKKAAPQQAAKQAAAKKSAAKKTAAKKTAAKKTAAKKLPAQKSAARAAARPGVTKKAAPAQKAAPKRAAAKRAAPRQAAATKAAPGQVPARKAPAKKAAARRVPTSRRPAPQAPSAQRMLAPARRPRPRLRRPPRPGNPDGRIRFVAVAASVVLLLIVGRLIQVQVIQAGPTAEAAFEQRSQVRTLSAARGSIVDRNGAVLATTVERRNVTVDQRIVNQYHVDDAQLPPSQVGITGAANALAPLLGMKVDDVREKLTGDRAFVYVKKSIEPAVWQQVDALEIPGVYSESANQRNYPNGQVAASVIGFVGKDGTPLAGIERAQQSVLQGRDGVLHYERGSNGQQIPTGRTTEVDPVPGRKVQLTIDSDLQWKAQQLLTKAVKSSDSKAGQAVVLNVKTGEVLALADAPSFNPNDYGSAKAENLQNRSLVDVFEPGSTSKLVTAAAALEEGKVTPESRLTVDYTIQRGGRTFHDSHVHGPEKLTFTGVLAQSSNTGTIQVGERVPAADMYRYMRSFGLGSATGVGLPESKGLLADAKDWNNSQRYTVLFGQGLSVTALQSAEVYATVANNGVRVPPRIVKAVQGEDGEMVPTAQPRGTRVVSDKTASQLREMLERVVGKEGTGDLASVPGYRVAGKTGTADYYDSDVGRYNGYTASFVGMAPADDPAIVVAVFLQQPKKNGYYGGTVAAPIFQKIMTYALAKEGIAPSTGKKPNLPLEWK